VPSGGPGNSTQSAWNDAGQLSQQTNVPPANTHDKTQRQIRSFSQTHSIQKKKLGFFKEDQTSGFLDFIGLSDITSLSCVDPELCHFEFLDRKKAQTTVFWEFIGFLDLLFEQAVGKLVG